MVASGLFSLIMALKICLLLRVLELANAWTAIIIDNRNGEDCYLLSCPTKYSSFNWVSDYGEILLSDFYADCQFFGKDTLKAIASRG